MSQSQDESQTDSSQSWRDALGPPPPMGTTKVSLPYGKYSKIVNTFLFLLSTKTLVIIIIISDMIWLSGMEFTKDGQNSKQGRP